MIASILAFICILSLSIQFSHFFNKKIEETIPTTIFLIIIWLYLCSLLNLLFFGWLAIIIISSFCFVRTIIYFNKNTLRLVFTPGLLFIFLSFAILFICNHSRFVQTFDEFNHWFIAAKNTFILNNLYSNEASNVLSKSYFPGSTIFHYFWLRFGLIYKEYLVFISMNFFILALLAPIFSLSKWSNWKKNIIITIVLFMFPVTIYSNIFTGAYVDGLMGLIFAYILYYGFISNLKDKFNLFTLYLALFTLPLIKASGIIITMIAVIFLLNNFLKKENNEKV